MRKTRVSNPSTPTRLFTIGWVVAVVIATAGWFYFIFEAAWHLIGALTKYPRNKIDSQTAPLVPTFVGT